MTHSEIDEVKAKYKEEEYLKHMDSALYIQLCGLVFILVGVGAIFLRDALGEIVYYIGGLCFLVALLCFLIGIAMKNNSTQMFLLVEIHEKLEKLEKRENRNPEKRVIT